MTLDDQIIEESGSTTQKSPSSPSSDGSGGTTRAPNNGPSPESENYPPQSPQTPGPSDSSSPLTSTPLSSSSLQKRPSSSTSSPSEPEPAHQSSVASISTPQSSFNLPLSPISSTGGETSTSNAVTVIQVQSASPNNHSTEQVPSTSSGSKTNTLASLRRPENDPDPDGLAITRINISAGEQEERATVTEQSQVVKVIVYNGNGVGGSPSDQQGQDATDAEVRRGLRLGQNQDGSSLHQEEIQNDTASEISSVVNNPSVISQAPDRYGFMGGEQYTHESEPDPSPEIIRRREMKWLGMMDKWDHYMRKDFKTVRSRCRKGIPRSVRGRAWYYLCGAAFIKKKQPDLFFTLLEKEGKPECIEDIKKDLHRQFPWHEIFAEEGHGQKDLFKVLKAHSILNEKDGYCQAQAPIAAILLMHMPAEDAFWCLVAICDKYLKGYYSPGMEQLQLDGDILFGLLKRVAPPVYKHMKKQKIDPVLYMTEWFLCAFTRTLPWTSVLRVWDSFLCEGVKVLFRVGLVLLKYTLGRTGALKQCPNMYDTLTLLKNLPNYVTHEQFLVVQVQRLDISDDQMRREHYKQITKRKKVQQKLEAARKQREKNNSRGQSGSAIVHKSHETAL